MKKIIIIVFIYFLIICGFAYAETPQNVLKYLKKVDSLVNMGASKDSLINAFADANNSIDDYINSENAAKNKSIVIDMKILRGGYSLYIENRGKVSAQWEEELLSQTIAPTLKNMQDKINSMPKTKKNR